jgi:hypothetical protein
MVRHARSKAANFARRSEKLPLSKGAIRRARTGYRMDSGVMIIPPSSYERAQISDSMRKIREEMKNKLGPEAYEERMKKSNDEFKALMAGREVRS